MSEFWHGANYEFRQKAAVTFATAIRCGDIRPIDRCEDCLRSAQVISPGSSRALIVGHHEDYFRPLYVYWLCQACHVERHRKGGWLGAVPSEIVMPRLAKRICIPAFGSTKTISEWSALTGLSEALIRTRFADGLEPERFLLVPPLAGTRHRFKRDWFRNWNSAQRSLLRRMSA